MANITTKKGWEAAAPRKAPYFHKIHKGTAVSLSKPGTGTMAWGARVHHAGRNWTKTFDTSVDSFAQATAETLKFEAEVKGGEVQTRKVRKGSALTVKALVEEYLDWDKMVVQKGDRYDAWRYTAERLAKCYVYPYIGETVAAQVTSEDLDDLQVQLLRKVSAETVNRGLVPLRAALNYAQKRGYFVSPTSGAPLLEEADAHNKINTKDYFDREARDAVLAAAGDDLKAVCMYMDQFGARAATARRMRVRDCHVDKRLRQPYVLMHTYKGNRVSGKSWKFPLAGKRLDFIREQIKGKDRDAYLFTTEKGYQWSEANLAKLLRKAVTKAGVDANFQQLTWRHCWVQDCVDAGMNTLKIAKLAGTSEKQILDFYTTGMDIDPDEIPDL